MKKLWLLAILLTTTASFAQQRSYRLAWFATPQAIPYELPCDTGSSPLLSPTYNPSTQMQRAWVCVDSFGTVTSPVFSVMGSGVTSFKTRTGAVVPASGDYTVAQVTGAAPLASPTFTGVPAAPTAATSTNTTQLATTAFVNAEITANSPVSSVFGRTGAVVSATNDYAFNQLNGTWAANQSYAGGSSTAFLNGSGTYTVPAGNFSLFGTTGTVTNATIFASTVVFNDPTSSLISMNANSIAGGLQITDAGAGVQINTDYPAAGNLQFCWNGCTSTMTMAGTAINVSGATLTGYALLAGPAFTGNPTATTQTALNNTTRLATTAFVQTSFAQPPITGFGNTVARPVSLTTLSIAGTLLVSNTAPTIASGFGTSPSIVNSNGTAAFTVNVGTGGAATNGVITMPAATTGWACMVAPNGAPQAAGVTYSAPTSTTSITLTNYTASTGVALAWSASYVLQVLCNAY